MTVSSAFSVAGICVFRSSGLMSLRVLETCRFCVAFGFCDVGVWSDISCLYINSYK